MGRFFKDFNVAPDRGRSFYQHERQRQHLASLVDAGRCGLLELNGLWLAAAFVNCANSSWECEEAAAHPSEGEHVLCVQACWAISC